MGMRICSALLLLLISLPANQATWANEANARQADFEAVYREAVRRNYRNTSRYLLPGGNIWLEGEPTQVLRLSAWLDRIYRVPHGRDTLDAIFASGSQLVIRHSGWALVSAGRTMAPLSSGLTNGLGEDVTVLFDTRIPESGSHWVFDRHGDKLEFTAVQSLFHELVHARHQLNGSWRYWDSEGQAIEEENHFRKQLAAQRGDSPARKRSGIEGQQFWWPAPPATARNF